MEDNTAEQSHELAPSFILAKRLVMEADHESYA